MQPVCSRSYSVECQSRFVLLVLLPTFSIKHIAPFSCLFLSITCPCSLMCDHYLSNPPVHEKTWAKAGVYPACVKTTFLLLDSPKYLKFLFLLLSAPPCNSFRSVCLFCFEEVSCNRLATWLGPALNWSCLQLPSPEMIRGTPLCHLAFLCYSFPSLFCFSFLHTSFHFPVNKVSLQHLK